MIEEFRQYAFPYIRPETFTLLWAWFYISVGLTLGVISGMVINRIFPEDEPNKILLSVPIGAFWPFTIIPCVVAGVVYIALYLFNRK